jgi:hypothetical protein
MFGKLALILATLASVTGHQNRYLRGPGNSTALAVKTNTTISNALVPYVKLNIKPSMCPINKSYYWTTSNTTKTKNEKDL